MTSGCKPTRKGGAATLLLLPFCCGANSAVRGTAEKGRGFKELAGTGAVVFAGTGLGATLLLPATLRAQKSEMGFRTLRTTFNADPDAVLTDAGIARRREASMREAADNAALGGGFSSWLALLCPTTLVAPNLHRNTLSAVLLRPGCPRSDGVHPSDGLPLLACGQTALGGDLPKKANSDNVSPSPKGRTATVAAASDGRLTPPPAQDVEGSSELCGCVAAAALGDALVVALLLFGNAKAKNVPGADTFRSRSDVVTTNGALVRALTAAERPAVDAVAAPPIAAGELLPPAPPVLEGAGAERTYPVDGADLAPEAVMRQVMLLY